MKHNIWYIKYSLLMLGDSGRIGDNLSSVTSDDLQSIRPSNQLAPRKYGSSSAVKSNQFQYFVKSTSNWPKTYSVTK